MSRVGCLLVAYCHCVDDHDASTMGLGIALVDSSVLRIGHAVTVALSTAVANDEGIP